MENNSWKSYVEQTKEKPPRPLLVEALQYVKIKNNALDVGSGSLNDSRFLIREGFAFVNAIDQAPVAQEISTSLPKDKFRYIISKIEDIELFPETYDLITAQFSLPFISPDSFEVTFAKLLSSLKKDGIFSGQFFGINDGWKDYTGMTFLSKEKALELLTGLELLHFRETEKEDKTAAGNSKHWHIFDFIVKK
jgi:hypothetical protein